MTPAKNTRILSDGKEYDVTTQKPVEPTALARYQTDHGVIELSVRQIQQHLCPKATESEAYMFLRLCQAQRLTPFLKEAYLVIFKGEERRVSSMIVGRDAFNRRAEGHEQFAGFRAGIIVELESGNVEEIDGAVVPVGGKLLGGWSLVFRKDRAEPHHTTTSDAEYNTGRKNWRKMPATMNRKVAIVQGLREVFPTVYAGADVNVDIGEADEVVGEVVSDSWAEPPEPSGPDPTPAPAPAPPRLHWCAEHGVDFRQGRRKDNTIVYQHMLPGGSYCVEGGAPLESDPAQVLFRQ
jgi:phage recombination protein Bet